MPQIKAAKRASAITKLHKIETKLREAEAIISSISADELEEIGFSIKGTAGEDSAMNTFYRVAGHASTVRIVREHLRTELRQ